MARGDEPPQHMDNLDVEEVRGAECAALALEESLLDGLPARGAQQQLERGRGVEDDHR
jgi:hypothetical protein